MKYTTASRYAFAIGALFIAVACSSEAKKPSNTDDDNTNTDDTNTDDTNTDDGNNDDTNNDDNNNDDNNNNNNNDDTNNDPGTQVCAATCTSDSDCQSTCPAVEGATACCDLTSQTCFNSTEAVCPAPVEDDAGDGAPPAY